MSRNGVSFNPNLQMGNTSIIEQGSPRTAREDNDSLQNEGVEQHERAHPTEKFYKVN